MKKIATVIFILAMLLCISGCEKLKTSDIAEKVDAIKSGSQNIEDICKEYQWEYEEFNEEKSSERFETLASIYTGLTDYAIIKNNGQTYTLFTFNTKENARDVYNQYKENFMAAEGMELPIENSIRESDNAIYILFGNPTMPLIETVSTNGKQILVFQETNQYNVSTESEEDEFNKRNSQVKAAFDILGFTLPEEQEN